MISDSQTEVSVNSRVTSVSSITVRNLRNGESSFLPPVLLDTGMAYLIPEWVWVVEPANSISPQPFAIIVTSFAHGWLVLWRILALSPLPADTPLNWFLEALPQVFVEARQRGCVGFMTLLSDDRPAETKMARIITRLANGGLMPFTGFIGAGMLTEFKKPEEA